MNDVWSAAGVNFGAILPELLMVIFAMIVMLVDMFAGNEESGRRGILPWVALAGVVITLVVCATQWGKPAASFQNMAVGDNFAQGFRLIVLVATGLAILLSAGYIQQVNRQTGEYYALLLLCAAGMMVMGAATDLIVVFIALEIFSLGLYILSGLDRRNPRSSEAGMKYFLLGAFASAFFVCSILGLRSCWSALALRSAWCPSTCGRPMSTRGLQPR